MVQGHTQVHNPNGSLVGLAVSVGLTVVSNRQTHGQTTLHLWQQAASLHSDVTEKENI